MASPSAPLRWTCSGKGEQVDQVVAHGQRILAHEPHIKTWGIRVGSRGSTRAVVAGSEAAAMAVRFLNHRWLCCKRIPRLDRRERLHASAGAAFLYGAGGWTLSSHVWQRCAVVEVRWLRPPRPSLSDSRVAWCILRRCWQGLPISCVVQPPAEGRRAGRLRGFSRRLPQRMSCACAAELLRGRAASVVRCNTDAATWTERPRWT